MRLYELELTSDLRLAYEPKDLKSTLKHYGWTYLGSGVDAIVAEHPQKKYVLKIFLSKSKYLHFIDFIENNQDNPYLPRFLSKVRKVPGTKYLYIRMEKLRSISIDTLLNRFFPEICWILITGKNNQIDTFDNEDIRKIMNILERYNIDLWDILDLKEQERLWKIIGRKPDDLWIKTIEQIIVLAKQLGSNADFYDKNFMLRKNTLVIIDPFS